MTFIYVFSMALTVLSNVAYHFCQKEISAQANPLVSLFCTYATGMFVTAVCFPFFYPGLNPITTVKSLNWATFGLGVAIVGLELGFLLAYRVGWNLSLGALYSNVAVGLILLPIGIWFYHESFEWRHALGILLALSGLVLMAKKG